MANVNIKFNGKEFLLSCEDGQEEHLEELSNHLNKKFDDLKSTLGNIGENKLLLITSITVMDEYFETKKKIDKKILEIENLTNKFKELKYLVFEYINRIKCYLVYFLYFYVCIDYWKLYGIFIQKIYMNGAV